MTITIDETFLFLKREESLKRDKENEKNEDEDDHDLVLDEYHSDDELKQKKDESSKYAASFFEYCKA